MKYDLLHPGRDPRKTGKPDPSKTLQKPENCDPSRVLEKPQINYNSISFKIYKVNVNEM